MYENHDEEGARCLECGEPVYGRTDKKFCNNNCRNRYHSHLRYAPVKAQNDTMHILSHNYAVLQTVYLLKGGSCPRSTLDEMGFKSEYVTQQVYKKGKHLEYRCFDFVYNLSENKLFNLRRI